MGRLRPGLSSPLFRPPLMRSGPSRTEAFPTELNHPGLGLVSVFAEDFRLFFPRLRQTTMILWVLLRQPVREVRAAGHKGFGLPLEPPPAENPGLLRPAFAQ